MEPRLGLPDLLTVLRYRKAVMAVVACYLGMDDAFIEAVLEERIDDFVLTQRKARKKLQASDHEAYMELLSAEAIVRYAATAAEGLAADPESDLAQHRVMGDTGGLGLCDDINASLRVAELTEPFEVAPGSADSDRILAQARRKLCNYFSVVAYDLVRGRLAPAIVDVMEELFLDRALSSPRVAEILRRQGLADLPESN